ncbi:MAG: transketolase [Mycobacteriales bacterium]
MVLSSQDLARAVRRDVVLMTAQAHSSHVGSCLSVVDILAVLYSGILSIDPHEPEHPNRDRLILSKGHAAAALYAVLAERGFFDRALLARHCADGSTLCGHVSHVGVPGVEFSTGSLGHGLPVAAGMALAASRSNPRWHVYAVLSDGECDEGAVWEAALFAAHHGLDNLTAVIDYNGLQSLATVADTLALEPFGDKWRAFGWDVVEVEGHDHNQLYQALLPTDGGRPRCVLAHTTKGKGVSFMEHSVLWHYRSPDDDELAAALAEIDAS